MRNLFFGFLSSLLICLAFVFGVSPFYENSSIEFFYRIVSGVVMIHMLNYPGLYIYFGLSFGLLTSNANVYKYMKCAGIIAFLQGLGLSILNSVVAGHLAESKGHYPFLNFFTFFIIFTFIIAGVLTGALHYFFVSKFIKRSDAVESN